MGATDNLTLLHKGEEELRAQSLAIIQADPELSDHWDLVAEAMNVIYAFTHDHQHGSENELTLQYLGIRLFNAAGGVDQACIIGLLSEGIRSGTRFDRDVFPRGLSLNLP